MIYREIAMELVNKYPHYYNCVYFGFVVEAVKNTVCDLRGVADIETIHKHITKNYI
jgi:hypothetical protein